MRETEEEPRAEQLSVGWQDGVPERGDHSLERAAAYAAILTRTLVAAGYQPRRIDIGLRLGSRGTLEMRVHGDVPRMPERDFASLARVTLRAATLAQEIDGLSDARVFATLEADVAIPDAAVSPQPATLRDRLRSLPLGRLAIAVVLGGLFGVVGLPRLELPFTLSSVSQPRPLVVVPDAPPQTQSEPTSAPVVPAATVFRASTPTPSAPRVLLAERFLSPPPNWPNNPDGFAWIGGDGFHLYARQSGRFVAVGVPLPQALTTAVLTAQFHKVGGGAGGGYGLIVRDQGSPSERDGRNQTGQYMVLEVGDRGDVGIWERNTTRWIDVMPWTHSDAVHVDRGTNTLKVTTRASTLRFEVNDQVLADLTYDGLPPFGGAGIFAGGDLNEVVLDSLRIET